MTKRKTAPRKKPQKLGTPYDALAKQYRHCKYVPCFPAFPVVVRIGQYQIVKWAKNRWI